MKSRPAVHRTILLLDVAGFSDRRRTNRHQVTVRKGMYRVLREAFRRSGLSWDDVDHEDRGDGVFVLATAPKHLFVDVLPHELADALRRYNEQRPEQERIRLRVALHAGEVVYDEHGATSASINLAFRLLDAAPLRQALATTSAPLAMITSEWFFEEVVRHSSATDPDRYHRVDVDLRETWTTGWIHVPGQSWTPLPPVDQPAGDRRLIPRQLPAATRDFVGRDDYVQALDALLPDEGASPGALVVVTLDGTAGVGKTTLAVHWAHRVQHRFPDGTLFVNLRGYGPSAPLAPALVLASFLRVLDVPDSRIPSDLDTQAGLYRSLMAGRRVLVVLDNAASPEQVRPLLPGTHGSMVVVTSRSRLMGLVVGESARRITVDLFSRAEAGVLLREIIGDELTSAEPDTVERIITACARLPLALRVAAARIAAHPDTMPRVADSLRATQDQLAALSSTADAGGMVRTIFDWSYQRLPADHARTFRRLGLHFGPRFSVHATAVLAGVDAATAHRQLDALADMHLVTAMGGMRYRMHDLLYAYAAYRAANDDPPGDRRRAVSDLVSWYGRVALTADKLIFPGLARVRVEPAGVGNVPPLAGRSQALRWMNSERGNLAAALQTAVDLHEHDAAIALAGTARFLALRERPMWVVRLEAESLGILAARAGRSRAEEALLLGFRGDTNVDLGRLADAEDDFAAVLAMTEELDDPGTLRKALAGLGQVRLEQNRYPEAQRYFEQALPLAQLAGDLRGQAVAHGNLSRTSIHLGRPGAALAHAEQELLLRRQAGDLVGEAYALHDIATAWQGLGDHQTAITKAEQAIAMYRGLDGTGQYIAAALRIMAISLRHTGELDRAKRCLTEAVRIMTAYHDPRTRLIREQLRRIGS